MRLTVLDRASLGEVGQRLQAATRKAGERLVCRPGCTSCCIGVFSINLLDAWRLRRGLEQLEEADPQRARAVRQRAEAAARLESCRVEPDPDGLENAILCELPNGEANVGPETTVAYALIPRVRLASDDRTDESRAVG